MARHGYAPGTILRDRRTPEQRADAIARHDALEDSRACKYCGASRGEAGMAALVASVADGYRCSSPACVAREIAAMSTH